MLFNKKKRMETNLADGFFVENPKYIIPFDITKDDISKIVLSSIKTITPNYFTTKCIALNGLEINLGLHFSDESHPGKLREFEVFFDTYSNLLDLYKQRQLHLEKTYGIPQTIKDGEYEKEMRFCQWIIGGTVISHYVFDRFGPEEHIQIIKL